MQALSEEELSHARWAHTAGEKAREVRAARLTDLADREDAIRTGLEVLNDEHAKGTKASSVRLRTGAYRHGGDDVVDREVDPRLSNKRRGEHPAALKAARAQTLGGRPPFSRLINRKGWALHLELAAIAMGHFRAEPLVRPDLSDIRNTGKGSWAVILGDAGKEEPRRRHVTDALVRLKENNLVALRSRRGKRYQLFDDWELFDEDGSRQRYTVPEGDVLGEGVLNVSVEFFLRGWASVLTGPEIVAYLMLRHLSVQYSLSHARPGVGVGIAPSMREGKFGVTKGTYAALNELEEFGLVERVTPRQPGKVKGDKPREVDRWRVVREALQRDGFDTVSTVLRERRTPARMARFDPLAVPLEFDVLEALVPAAGTDGAATTAEAPGAAAVAELPEQRS